MKNFRFLVPVTIFLFALGIGLFSSQLFEGTKKTTTSDAFTFEEAVAKLRKRVRSTCAANHIRAEETTGRTMFVRKDEIAKTGYTIAIDWDYSMRGKHEIVFSAKDSYEKCIVEVGEAEE
jgi:hypothetical protein